MDLAAIMVVSPGRYSWINSINGEICFLLLPNSEHTSNNASTMEAVFQTDKRLEQEPVIDGLEAGIGDQCVGITNRNQYSALTTSYTFL